jgi:hypothetical protein
MGQCSAWSYVTVEAESARAERQLQHLPAATAAAAVVVRPSRRRVLKALQALPLQVLHLACEASPSATYGVTASWPSGRPSRVMVSSAAGLIITVTDGAGEVIEREAGCATGLGPVSRMMVVDHSVRLRRPQASMVLTCSGGVAMEKVHCN